MAAHVPTLNARRIVVAVAAFLGYLLLTRSDVILLSKQGTTVWFPATGLAFAFLIAIGPEYLPVFCLASAASPILVYHLSVYMVQHRWAVARDGSLHSGCPLV